MDRIRYDFRDVEILDFDPEFFDLWLSRLVARHEMKLGEFSFIFCSDDHLLELNRIYLGHDYYTDILTFDYKDDDGLKGEFFISYDRVVENAGKFGNGNLFDELCRVMAHGVLHLMGFDDKNETNKGTMRKMEEEGLGLR